VCVCVCVCKNDFLLFKKNNLYNTGKMSYV
jgi:hypothetical protein